MVNIFSLSQEALAGLSAGIVGTVVGFPLDYIKARMQVSKSSHNNFVEVGQLIVRQHGFFALYRGVAPPLISLSILNTINFTTYTYLQESFYATRGWDIRNAIAGAAVGPLAATISTVENLVKTQMQVAHLHGAHYRSSFDCLQQILQSKNGGWTTLYTGHIVNTTRESCFLFIYFGLYEGFRENILTWQLPWSEMRSEEIHPKKFWAIPLSGGLAGALAWIFSFPLDCVRAGVQGQALNLQSNSSRQQHSRKTARHVFHDLLATKGIRGLYSGVTPSVVRAFLVSSTRFTAFETALWLLRGGRDVQH